MKNYQKELCPLEELFTGKTDPMSFDKEYIESQQYNFLPDCLRKILKLCT